MSGELATAEGAFEILEDVEDEIDTMITSLDENLEDNDIDLAAECVARILDLLRARIHLKKFILLHREDGSTPVLYVQG